MAATVDFTPTRLDVRVYGSDPWALDFKCGGPLSDLTGATIEVKFKPVGLPLTDLTVTDIDLSAGEFAIQDVGGRSGPFDIEITLPDASPRTYVYGTVSMKKDVA